MFGLTKRSVLDLFYMVPMPATLVEIRSVRGFNEYDEQILENARCYKWIKEEDGKFWLSEEMFAEEIERTNVNIKSSELYLKFLKTQQLALG